MGKVTYNDPFKITRSTRESLRIKISQDEIDYRNKNLPDPTSLKDEKLVCTVCTVSLAHNVHDGRDIFVHRALQVLVCERCFNFYGDGCFSTDEDGDDKYCRWCGQGGTLYICSCCNVAFCKGCIKNNLKLSAQASVEKDDWKCFICHPRPIFGSRTICWAAKEINEIAKEEKICKVKKQGERLKKMLEERTNRKRKSKEHFLVEDEVLTKRPKLEHEGSDSSSVYIPVKKLKHQKNNSKSFNGSVKHARRKPQTTSGDESSEDENTSKVTRRNKVKQQEKVASDSSEKDSDVSSDLTSSDDDSVKNISKGKSAKNYISPFSKQQHKKHKKKTKSLKKEAYSSESFDSDYSEKHKKNKLKKRKHSSNESSEEDKQKHEKKIKEKSSSDSSDEHDSNRTSLEAKDKCVDVCSGSELPDSIQVTTADKPEDDDEERNHDKECSPIELSQQESESETTLTNTPVAEDIADQHIKLAMTWLNDTANDISDLGSLISTQANKFSDRRLNPDKLNTYEDVLGTLSKLKLFINGVHTNYSLIEESIEKNLQEWKVLVGVEDPPSENPVEAETSEVNDSVKEGVVDEEPSKVDDKEANEDNKLSVSVNNSNNCPEDETGNGEQEMSPLEKETCNEVNMGQQDIEADSNVETVSKDTHVNNETREVSQGKEVDNETEKLSKVELDNSTSVDAPLPVTGKDKAVEINTIDRLKLQSDSLSPDDDSDTEVQQQEALNSKNEESSKVDQIGQDQSMPQLSSDNSICVEGSNMTESNISNNVSTATVSNTNVNETNLDSKDTSGTTIEEVKEHNVISEDKNELAGFEQSESSEDKDREQPVSKDNQVETRVDGQDENHIGASQEDSSKKDSESLKALQQMLNSSSEDEKKSSWSDSDDVSSEIQLDDSDLDFNKQRKVVLKKKAGTKKKESKSQARCEKNEVEDEESAPKKQAKKEEEELDSEAEIDMLTDLTQLKKKTFSRNLFAKESTEEDSDESSEEEDDNENNKEGSKKRKKYNNEVKKRREEERNELFRFLEGNSSSEDELDITKKDLDVIEDKYASSNSDSMSMEAISQKMNAKWKELEQEQEEMNLKMLLASDSEEGSIGGDDIILNPEKKKKKVAKKKIKDDQMEEDEATKESNSEQDEVKEDKVDEEESTNDANSKTVPDEEYEQFLEGMTKNPTTFKGLGSSSSESSQDGLDIKDEPVSDDVKIKKESKESDVTDESSESDTSGDLFLGKSKRESGKQKSWRNHKLLRMKLSETDTSDEERWWQRRLEKEKKKKENQGDSDSSGFDDFAQGLIRPKTLKKADNRSNQGSDKENKKVKKDKKKVDSDSSTMELSSTESSDSSVFKKKKRKKHGSSDSDIQIISEDDKKKKKKKKKRWPRESSDESGESGDDVVELSQKSTLGESPGKGGRKNIRKVLTKHELAAATKAAAREEEERKKRIAARQKQYNEMFEIKEAEILQKLVLDFDPDTKTELISVDQDLVVKMKPHQAKGVKFMWDSCFESLSQLKTKKGSGCILAHCMGLGKTFQVVSLVHTILKNKDTNVKTVLVVCPLSTVLNWASEFRKWLDDVEGGRDIKIYHLTKYRRPHERTRELSQWHRVGGVMILGYEMFRNLSNESTKKFRLHHMEIFQKTLIDPGADLVVCDEGHMLKNESTALSKAMSRIKTLRRIVLTGTPMQNNLKEYHCMVQFVKPNLLGTRREFLNQFVNPITNGQFVDSTESDVKVMKRRSHVLHKMLEGLVQRFDYSVLTPFLPPKHEYVISLRLSEVQVKLYQYYLDHISQRSNKMHTGSTLFPDWQALGRIWTHPLVLKMSTDKAEKEKEKLRLEESDDENEGGSMKDFIDDKSSSVHVSSSHSSSSSDDEEGKKGKIEKKTEELKKEEITVTPDLVDIAINLISSDEEEENKNKDAEKNGEKSSEDVMENNIKEENDLDAKEEDTKAEEEDKPEEEQDNKEEKQDKEEKTDKADDKAKKVVMESKGGWWRPLVEPEHLDDINQSAKLVLLFAILRECEMIEDKILVFSQSLFSLDLIEFFLQKIDQATEENRLDESLGNQAGCWVKGLDYFRLDGSTSSENRSTWCKSFNREDNPRARLFLISTRAGGLGINLTGANRVIIFDASWNPSHDVQSIFRIYRFGQKKPCYVYRFIANGTMEEKVYERQVAKQSLSSRVVDEMQVHRHFSMNDLNELYTFTPPVAREERPTPVLPRDRLMAELLTQYHDWIDKYHEHDSLLENVVEEELNEEERQLAWEDFENDKMHGPLPNTGGVNYQNLLTPNQIELFRKSLQTKFPNSTEQELNAMLKTLMLQVSYRNFNNTQQFTGRPQQPVAQQGTSTSQAGMSQTAQPTPTPYTNTGMSPQQRFNNQRNHLYNKYYQEIPGGKMGNAQIRQNHRVGNTQAKIGNDNYFQQMRQQQQATLARVQNQPRMQQAMVQNQLSQPTQQLKNIYQPVQNRRQQQVIQNRQQQPTLNSQQQLTQNGQKQPILNRQQQHIQNRQLQQSTQNRQLQQSTQNRQQMLNRQRQITNNRQATTNWKPTQEPLVTVPKPNLNQRARTTNRQIPIAQTVKNPPQPVQKTEQQLRQEEMRKRISHLQQEKQMFLQRKLQPKSQGNIASAAMHKKKLEEMKNRYRASRNNMSTAPVSIVEIDDDPVRPSGSSA